MEDPFNRDVKYLPEAVDTFLIEISNTIGFPVDQVKSLLCLLVNIPLGFFVSFGLASNYTAKHLFFALMGFAQLFFCYGYHMYHPIGTAAITYLALYIFPRKKLHYFGMIFPVFYLSFLHIYRQYYDYGGFRMDITSPQMVLTQKMCSIAFDLYDGTTKKEEDLTPTQKKLALKKVPSLLHYIGYMFNFTTVTTGPSSSFKEYLAGVETDYTKKDSPNPTMFVLKSFLFGLGWGLFHTLVGQYVSKELFFNEETQSMPLYLRPLIIHATAVQIRSLYYFAWALADCSSVAAGLGYQGNGNWFVQVQPFSIEMPMNMRDITSCWNRGTNNWLRRYAYERVSPSYAQFYTFMLSAFWHGFYPGYYLFFFIANFMNEIARQCRRQFRAKYIDETEKLLNGSRALKVLYDIVGGYITVFMMSYIGIVFSSFSLEKALIVFKYVYFVPLIGEALVFAYFKMGAKKNRKSKKGTSQEVGSSETKKEK
uniref:Membrane bound O-acyl transferase n=1 Tax=Palpitomonas bilix TaxID=652834 RepID=A0A7S3D759_9EUKA|mmetsp:Transcript_24732/g.62606  ORF Transcript_24732/g.62606 Transcript_24732/m.62606 type:complete len:481 (+) Transcript_24732:89-1531(+)